MNRKDINDLIKKLLPVPSSIIGSPRKTTEMGDYLKIKPRAGTVDLYDSFDFSSLSEVLPFLFKSKNLILKHSTFTARLNAARVWGRNGAVIGADDYFIKDVSREFNEDMNVGHSIHYTLKQTKSKLLTGNIAVIGTAGANIYYHWMLDILPRLALISKNISVDAINHFITEYTDLPFQTETLEKVGIPVSKIIPSNENWNFHVKAGILWVPSLVGPLGQPTAFQVNFLRNLYKDCLSTKRPTRKIYISRKKVGRREIINEDDFLQCLSNFQFEIINCEGLKVSEQVKLFSEAAIVIASHGSAFTNLVFCNPGTTVLDIFNSSHINACFWIISQYLDLNYQYMTGTSCPIDRNPKNDNTLVDIAGFKKTLEELKL